MNMAMHWKALRPLMVGWGLIFSIVATGLGVVLYQQYSAENDLEETIKRWRDAQQQYLQYADYQPDLNRYFAYRSAWQNAGVMQPPNIDRWASRWENMQQQFGLPHLEYQIQPSIACAVAGCGQRWPLKSLPTLNVLLTPVHLSWHVNHEAQSIAWLQRLRTEYAAMLIIRHCQWRLADDSTKIAAECDLDMVHFPDATPQADQQP